MAAPAPPPISSTRIATEPVSLALALHALAAVIWVGGMFFAFICLRPAAMALDPPVRLRLWANVLSRFFRWVFGSALLLLASGLWMSFQYAGGLHTAGTHIQLMLVLGLAMMLIAAHVYFAPYKRLKRYVGVSNWPEAAKHLKQIRNFIGLNLLLGVAVVLIAAGGRYWH